MDIGTLRKCKICKVDKSLDLFNSKRYSCKDCDSLKYKENKINDRKQYRDEFKQMLTSDGMSEDDFNKLFIPIEKYNIMKRLTELYSFCESKKIKKLDYQQYKSAYDKNYITNVAFCCDNKRNSGYVIHII